MTLYLTTALAAAFIMASLALDWPRAVCGLALGLIGRRLPFATILVPAGSLTIAVVGELVYADLHRPSALTAPSFATGLFAATAAAIGVYQIFYQRHDRHL